MLEPRPESDVSSSLSSPVASSVDWPPFQHVRVYFHKRVYLYIDIVYRVIHACIDTSIKIRDVDGYQNEPRPVHRVSLLPFYIVLKGHFLRISFDAGKLGLFPGIYF